MWIVLGTLTDAGEERVFDQAVGGPTEVGLFRSMSGCVLADPLINRQSISLCYLYL